MSELSYIQPIKVYFADTIQNKVSSSNLLIGRSHCFELIAAFFGFNTYAALKANGLLSRDKYLYQPEIDLGKLSKRASHLEIPEPTIKIVEDCLLSMHYDEQDHITSLSKRLARKVKYTATLHKGYQKPIFASGVYLDEQDWENCGNVASSDEFEDYLYTYMPGPTIQFIVLAHRDANSDGYYEINVDPIVNIIEFLAPNEIHKLLHEMDIQ